MKEKSKKRIKDRKVYLETVINERGRKSDIWQDFSIINADILTENVLEELALWGGGKYQDPETIDSKDKCFKKVREHWNRQKAESLGTQFISPILHQLFQVNSTKSNIYVVTDWSSVTIYNYTFTACHDEPEGWW